MYDWIRKPRALAVFGGGTGVVLLVAFTAPPSLHTVLLGLLLVVVLMLLSFHDERKSFGNLEHLEIPMTLARDEDVFQLYRRVATAFKGISSHRDPILREFALNRAEQAVGKLSELANRRIVFVGTEAWRMAYDQVLRSPGLHLYRSVAVIKTKSYWQDEPGRQSTRLNLEMIDSGSLNIERIAIISDDLWSANERLPSEPIRQWIEKQHNHGLWIKLVRQSEIAGEPQLTVDLGIYGNRAVGVQELDDQGRTVRFTLSFDFEKVLSAERRWERLSLYATSYRDLLDREAGSS